MVGVFFLWVGGGGGPFFLRSQVLKDWAQGEQDHTLATAEETDIWRWIQLSFFFADAQVEGQASEHGGPRKKQRKLIGKPRASAKEHLRALDHLLLLVCGFGLSAFVGRASDTQLPLSSRRLLVLFLDEGSPQYALCLWMSYRAKIRLCSIRDPFHREWNDCQHELKKAGVWWVVITGTLCFNLPYGPWQGCAWFSKMLEHSYNHHLNS